ncbi:MAG: methyltransferase domain-containing protein [Thermoleophilaceae bacterium]|jgi:phospholipid N-methyltransferase|nr:methyltransferase domain-containing protein [Thermoleophilaceae bacterium]
MGRAPSDSAGGDRRRFLRSFLASPRKVGAVLPTSRRTVRDTLDLAPVEQARWVVELGAGTGVYTRAILERMGSDARVLAFEVDPDLSSALASELRDPRLSVVNDSAVDVARHLDGETVDVIVSAVPFTSLQIPERKQILRAARDVLGRDGIMLVLQYSPLIERELRQTFTNVRRRLSPLNVPPAFLYACQGDPRSHAGER